MTLTRVIALQNYGGYAGRLRRLCGKIREVMQEVYGGYMGKLRRLCGKITEVIQVSEAPSRKKNMVANFGFNCKNGKVSPISRITSVIFPHNLRNLPA